MEGRNEQIPEQEAADAKNRELVQYRMYSRYARQEQNYRQSRYEPRTNERHDAGLSGGRDENGRQKPAFWWRIFRVFLILFMVAAVVAFIVLVWGESIRVNVLGKLFPNMIADIQVVQGDGQDAGDMNTGLPEGISESITEAVPEVQTEAEIEMPFTPQASITTIPEALIDFTEIEVDGQLLEDQSQYAPWYHMDFGTGDTYTDMDGIITFRGNNFRDNAAYGTANMATRTFEEKWQHTTGAISYGSATWTGSGWTGQPLIVRWPAATKAHMNMQDWAKEKDDLVEVIYACMDGYVYFFDLETGEETREALYLGWTFKGAGALDPRGYPIMYLGAGYDSGNGTARVFIINLLDCSVMYEFGNLDPFSLRGSLSYFDSSALVDAASDTLIYPGENGILYLMHLNTNYNEEAGTLSIDPDHIVKWRYQGVRTSGASYWVGMETSAAVYEGYMFIADNGGNLMCMDLNTLQLVWVADILDDSNSTPVLSMEDGHLYLYVSTSFHYGWRSYNTATVPIWKIDAQTGETVWQHDYECYTQEGVSGGVQSTIAPGRDGLEDYIYVTVSRTGGYEQGVLACIDKKTGELVWDHGTIYAWSSPVCVYDDAGKGYVIYCSCGGKMFLLDGLTGGIYDSFELSNGAIEASPAVYDDRVVIGTRACRIFCLQLK